MNSNPQSDDFTHFSFDNEHAKMIYNFCLTKVKQKYKIVWGSAVTPPGSHMCANPYKINPYITIIFLANILVKCVCGVCGTLKCCRGLYFTS